MKLQLRDTRLGPVAWLLKALALVGRVAYWAIKVILWIFKRWRR